MELSYMIYKSVPAENITESNLLDIAERSKGNNIDKGLTGLLVYGNKEFVQVLEGTENDIEVLYQKLLTDKRHSNMKVVKRGKLDRRYLPIWSMGFRSVSNEEMQLIEKAINGEQPKLVENYIALEMIAGFLKRNS